MTPKHQATITAKCCKEIENAIKGNGKVKHTQMWRDKRAEMIKRICVKYEKDYKFICKLMGIK